MITHPSRLPSKLGASGVKRRREHGVGAEAETSGVCHPGVPQNHPGYHTPGTFAKRVRKLLKTKDGSRKKTGKRF
jgi:hypothetical protein